MSRRMLTHYEIESIKDQIRSELRAEIQESIRTQITGASGRLLKRILRILSLNLGIELKLPKDLQ